eukprot:8191312-Prorocentrum_lima.AAC.1
MCIRDRSYTSFSCYERISAFFASRIWRFYRAIASRQAASPVFSLPGWVAKAASADSRWM